MRQLHLLVVCALAVTAAPVSALAQSATKGRIVIALGVTSSDLPTGVSALIIRAPHRSEPDMVVVDQHADPSTVLPGAFAMVRRLREDNPNPTNREIHRVTSVTALGSSLPAAARERLDVELRMAKAGRRTFVVGVGDVRLVNVSIR